MPTQDFERGLDRQAGGQIACLEPTDRSVSKVGQSEQEKSSEPAKPAPQAVNA
jgi:hypothetical protein